MTSEAVFIQVGALADGFAPHGNLLATASLPAGENFTFYVAGSEPQQLVIEDEQTLSFARLDAQPGPLPGFTTALVGMRNQYTYSPTERYEHIYLNDNFYAWQCLDGVEKGLADVDRCHYVQVAEDLYLFVWREKIIPTLGVILIDLQQMRTDGKIMGYQGSDFGALSNFPVGASAKILNVTRHQE